MSKSTASVYSIPSPLHASSCANVLSVYSIPGQKLSKSYSLFAAFQASSCAKLLSVYSIPGQQLCKCNVCLQHSKPTPGQQLFKKILTKVVKEKRAPAALIPPVASRKASQKLFAKDQGPQKRSADKVDFVQVSMHLIAFSRVPILLKPSLILLGPASTSLSFVRLFFFEVHISTSM